MLTGKAKRSEYIKAGVALCVGLVILSAFMVVLGGHWFWERLTDYEIRFVTVKDLTPGRPVKYAGLDIGRVKSINVHPDDPRFIRVIIGVNHDFPLYSGCVARIAQKGLVGDYYVLVEMKEKPGEKLRPGAIIPAVQALDMQELSAKIGDLLDGLKPRIDEIAENIEKLFSDSNVAALSKVFADVPELVVEVKTAVKDFRGNWQRLSDTGVNAGGSLDKALGQVNVSVGAVQKELVKTLEEFRVQTKNAGIMVGELRANVDHDQEQLEDILRNLVSASRELRDLSGRLRERPWEVIRPPSEGKK